MLLRQAAQWEAGSEGSELCELCCCFSNWGIFMESISLGPAGFQYTHLHIKTAQERDSAEAEWGRAEEGTAAG
jgi:hypothetical protein